MPAIPSAPTSARLFLALWPSPEVRAALVAHQSLWQWPPAAACVAPEKLHVTLHFLGDQPQASIAPLQRALDTLPRAEPFVLEGWRPTRWHGGLAVLEPVPQAGLAPLSALHAALAEVLRQQGLPVEARPFRPHVTLARRAAGATPPEEVPLPRWPAQGVALVLSERGRYQVLSVHGGA